MTAIIDLPEIRNPLRDPFRPTVTVPENIRWAMARKIAILDLLRFIMRVFLDGSY